MDAPWHHVAPGGAGKTGPPKPAACKADKKAALETVKALWGETVAAAIQTATDAEAPPAAEKADIAAMVAAAKGVQLAFGEGQVV